jgi:hypothetical protein
MKRLFIMLRNGFILFFLFIFVFFLTTALFDTLERHLGYYDQGIADSKAVGD